MRIALLKILLFSFVFFVVAFFVNDIFINKKIYWFKSEEYKSSFSKSNQIDVAFFGSSHALCSYDPRVIENEIKNSAFNFGYANQRLVTAIPLIKTTVKNYGINLAVIDVFQASMEQPPYNDNVNAFQLKTFDYMPLSLKKIVQLKNIYGPEGALYNTPLLREHALWDEKLFQDYFKLAEDKDYYKGFYTNTSFNARFWKKITKNTKLNNNPKTLDTIQLSDSNKALIKDLLGFFRENQTQVIFVNAAVFKGYESNEFYTYNNLLETFLKSLGITYINLNAHYDEIGLTKKDFRDFSHLNSSGALKVTKFLTNFIKSEFSIPSNTKINFNQNRYFHIDKSFEYGLHYFKASKKLQQKIEIKSVGIYKINNQYLELVVEKGKEISKNLKVKITYKTGAYTDKYSIRALPVKLNNNKYLSNFKLDDSIEYGGKQYFIVRVPIPMGEVYDFNVFIKNKKNNNVKIIKIDTLRLEHVR